MQLLKKIFSAILLVAIGVLIAVYSDVFIIVLVVAAGIYLLIKGIFSLFYDKFGDFAIIKAQMKMRRLSVIRSVIGIVLGIFAIIAPFAFGHTVIVVIAYVLGASMLFSAFVAAEDAYYQKKAGFDVKASILQVLLHVLIAIVMFVAPQEVAFTVVKVLGIVLASAAGVWLVMIIVLAVKASKLKKKSEAEAQVID